MAKAKRFPILNSDRPDPNDVFCGRYTSIPWGLAERVYEDYASLWGREQSIERMAERGGLGWGEMMTIMVMAQEQRDRLADQQRLEAAREVGR